MSLGACRTLGELSEWRLNCLRRREQNWSGSVSPAYLWTAQEPKVAVDEMPAKVKAFWFGEEPTIPPWRLKSAAEREQREFLENAGMWTG